LGQELDALVHLEVSGSLGHDPLDEHASDGWGEQRLSLGDNSDRVGEFSGWEVFQEEPAGAGFESGIDVFVVLCGF
jgi:hypothetical protein